ncbi:hypothetical protein PSPO01_04821 [Paraphaeosphaeria sporulosa]
MRVTLRRASWVGEGERRRGSRACLRANRAGRARYICGGGGKGNSTRDVPLGSGHPADSERWAVHVRATARQRNTNNAPAEDGAAAVRTDVDDGDGQALARQDSAQEEAREQPGARRGRGVVSNGRGASRGRAIRSRRR